MYKIMLMKRSLLIFVVLFFSVSCFAQDITGAWYGALNVQGMKLRIVFHISKSDTGYVSTMDSPDQGAKGIPVTTTTFNSPDLMLELPALGITCEGKLENDTTIKCDFRQSGLTFPLILSRSRQPAEKAVRPQEPKKPYPYISENVTFKNIKDSVTLAGTLTLPEKSGKFPVVILISGSGAQNRDEEIMGHKPFLVLADYLTRHGIAVLRYDDRGVGGSTGSMKTATSEDFVNDVMAAIKYLKTKKEIDKHKIGLIGHSEGGMIAPMVASRSKDVSFIVLLAGPGIRGADLLLKQEEEIYKASGISDEQIKRSAKVNQALFNIILNTTDDTALKEKLTNYLVKTFDKLPEQERPSGMDADDFTRMTVAKLTSPWMLYFLRYDPAPVLEKVKCPVLALNGSKDLQVNAKINLTGIRNALEKGGNKDFTIKDLPGLNHLFQECTTGLPTEYSQIEQTFSPAALKIISDWIKSKTE